MKQKKSTTIILILIFLVGLSLLLYPSVSDYWNSFTQSRAIASYVEAVANMDGNEYDHLWQMAYDYNTSLNQRGNNFTLSDDQRAKYEQLLNVGGNGVMGYVEVPSIDVSLPIYHGTDEGVLQVAVGHLEWTSLPVGGEGSHCVISGHRGLPSAKLFTDLDEIVAGDTFLLRILDETLTYEVDQILIVLPHEISDLTIEPGKDYCTLVTCTPYGVNSHRMLVRGHRIETVAPEKEIRVTADAMQIEPLLIAPMMAVPVLLVLLIALMIPRKRKPNGDDDDEM